MNQDLQDFIKQSKESGMTDEQIKQELLKAGWDENDINQFFKSDLPTGEDISTQRTRRINIGGMIKWVILGLVPSIIFGALLAYLIRIDALFWPGIIIPVILFGFMGARTKTAAEKRSELAKQAISEEGLSRNEKIAAWFFGIINPIIAGAVMYYMWRRRYPTKAKQANHISMFAFLGWLIFGVIIGLAL